MLIKNIVLVTKLDPIRAGGESVFSEKLKIVFSDESNSVNV